MPQTDQSQHSLESSNEITVFTLHGFVMEVQLNPQQLTKQINNT